MGGAHKMPCHVNSQESLTNYLTGRVATMGWVSNDNEHEGWAAAVAPDGRLSGSSTSEGILVEGITGRYKPDRMMRTKK